MPTRCSGRKAMISRQVTAGKPRSTRHLRAARALSPLSPSAPAAGRGAGPALPAQLGLSTTWGGCSSPSPKGSQQLLGFYQHPHHHQAAPVTPAGSGYRCFLGSLAPAKPPCSGIHYLTSSHHLTSPQSGGCTSLPQLFTVIPTIFHHHLSF